MSGASAQRTARSFFQSARGWWVFLMTLQTRSSVASSLVCCRIVIDLKAAASPEFHLPRPTCAHSRSIG